MSPRLRRILAISSAVALGVVLVVPTAVLVALDRGAADGLVRQALQAKLKRSVRFSRLHAHLLSRDPVIVLEDLAIGSPPEITTHDLLRAKTLTAHLRAGALFLGRVEPVSMALAEAELRLVRLGHGRNNYSFGQGGSGGLLASVKSLSVPAGRFRMDDPERKVVLAGAVSLDGRPGVALPLALDARGAIAGGDVTLIFAAGPLNGVRPGTPWPLDATLVDGATRMRIAGKAQRPFDFAGFDLQVHASGPNLAGLGYLVGTPTPNSRPFVLDARVRRAGRTVRLTALRARLGESDLAGEVVDDHERPRQRMTVRLTSRLLDIKDVAALMAAVPAHAATRVNAGLAGGVGEGLASPRPFPVAVMRKRDLVAVVKAARVVGLPLAVRDLDLQAKLAGGRLELSPVRFALASGRVDAGLTVDAAPATPRVGLTARLSDSRLAALKPGLAPTADGRLDAGLDLSGDGASMKAAMARAQGRGALRLSDGRIDRIKGSALGGDLLGAVGAALGGRKADLPLPCAVVEARAFGGALRAERLVIVTGAGVAQGTGSADLGRGTIDLRLVGHPTKTTLLRSEAPITVSGPLAHPKVAVETGGATAQGAAGAALAVVATPLAAVIPFLGGKAAPPPNCAALLRHAADYVR